MRLRSSYTDRGNHEARDRNPVLAQVAHRRVVRSVEQHRRHEQHEHELRIDLDLRRGGHSKASATPPSASSDG
jgi:hypothetical protein